MVNTAVVRVRTATGQHEFFNLDSLRDDLEASALAAGVREPAIVENILEVVGAFVGRQYADGRDLLAVDLDRLVIRILCDLGQGGVAHHFQTRRQTPPALPETHCLEPTPEAVAALLANDAFLVAAPLPELARETALKLRLLGLGQVPDALARELARTLWLEARRREPATVMPEDVRYWAVSRDEAQGLAAAAFPDPDLRAAVSVLPVSVLLPTLHVQATLDRLCPGAEPLVELMFFPRFSGLCAGVQQVVQNLRDLVQQRLVLGPGEEPLARVRFLGLPRLPSGRQRSDLGRDLENLARGQLGPKVQISFAG